MAIGDNNSSFNSNNNNKYDPTYYGRLRFKSAKDDGMTLATSFRSGMLIITFQSVDKNNGFKSEDVTSIFIVPTKAKILSNELDNLKKDLAEGHIDFNKAYGVDTGMGEKKSYIAFRVDSNKDVHIEIAKFNGEDGTVYSRHEVVLGKEHFGLEWDNLDNMSLSKNYYETLELDQIHELLTDFSRSMNGAIGYSSADINRYESYKLSNKLDPIYDKLGIERRNNSQNNRSSYNPNGNNFLNNAKSTSRSLEDLESMYYGNDEE